MRHVSLLGALGRGFVGMGKGLVKAGQKENQIRRWERRWERREANRNFELLQQLPEFLAQMVKMRNGAGEDEGGDDGNDGECSACQYRSPFVDALNEAGAMREDNIAKLTKIYETERLLLRSKKPRDWYEKRAKIAKIYESQVRVYLSQNQFAWNACILWDVSLWGHGASMEVHDAIAHLGNAYGKQHSHGKSAAGLPLTFDFGFYFKEDGFRVFLDDLWESLGDELKSGRLRMTIDLADRFDPATFTSKFEQLGAKERAEWLKTKSDLEQANFWPSSPKAPTVPLQGGEDRAPLGGEQQEGADGDGAHD